MSYAGNTYHLPLNKGRNNNSNQSDKSPSDLEVAINIALHSGLIEKDFGEDNITPSSLTDDILAGVDFYPTESAQRTVIFVNDGSIRKSSGVGDGAFTNIKTGLTIDTIPQFVQAGRELTNSDPTLFFFNGVNFPQYMDADASSTERIGFLGSLTNKLSTTNIDATLGVNFVAHGLGTGDTVSLVGFTNPLNGQDPNVSGASVTRIDADNFTVEMAGNANATASATGGTGKVYAHPVDWLSTNQPKGGVFHSNRLIVFQGQSIYGSSESDHNNFEAGGDVFSRVVESGLGAEIRAAAVFQNRLVVFKHPTGIVQIADVFTNEESRFVVPVQLGIAGKNSFCNTTEGDLLFISQLGSIHSLAAVQEFGDIKASSLTQSAYLDSEIKSMIDMSKLDKSCMAFDSYNKVAYAAYASKGSSYNDFIIKIDLSAGFPRISYTDKGEYLCFWNQKDSASEERLVSGTSDGYIRNLNSPTRIADGIGSGAYTARFRHAYTDLRDQYPQFADINKRFDFLEFTIQPTETDISLDVNVYVDGNLRDSPQVSLQTEALTFPLTFPVQFSNDSPRPVRLKLDGCYGRTISVEMINDEADQNFKISDLKIKFRPGDERILE